jgi:DNA-binding MarR family transcriptional regulator
VTSVADKRPRPRSAPPFRLEAHLFYYFSQILARRTRALNAELRPFGLDYPRWRVLAVLNENPDCSMQRLADASSVDRTTLTRTVNLMEAEGLVSRRPRATDRRGVEMSLTPLGRRTLETILPLVLAETDRALAGFAAGEIEGLRRQLGRMVENLRCSRDR